MREPSWRERVSSAEARRRQRRAGWDLVREERGERVEEEEKEEEEEEGRREEGRRKGGDERSSSEEESVREWARRMRGWEEMGGTR